MKKSANDDSGRRTLTLVLFLFVIPLIAFIASVGVEANLNSTVRQALREQYPDKAAAIAKITVSELCAQAEVRADPNTSDVCELNDHVSLMKSGALWTAGIAFLLLVSIRAAGILCRRRRTLLVLLFAPGLHLTMLILSALTILYAVLGMAAIYYGESALIGRVHFGIMFGLALFAVVGVVALVNAQFRCVKKATTFELAQRIELEGNEALEVFVTQLAGEMAAEMPNAVIAGLAPNFYVTEADVVCLNGRLSGRTMYVSLPLCRMLNLEELKAVLAHELAHYKGLDTRFSQRFYTIYRGASQGLINLASGLSEKGGAGQVVLLPALTALGYFLDSFSEAEREISRERELAADAEAAKVGGSHYLASALVKLHAFSGVWPAIRQGMKEAIENGKAYTNASALFEAIVNDIDKEEALHSVSEEGPPHPTDTHPPLSERLRNLNLRIDDVSDDARTTRPEHAAIELFAEGAELEGELTKAEQAIMIRTGEAQPHAERAASAGN